MANKKPSGQQKPSKQQQQQQKAKQQGQKRKESPLKETPLVSDDDQSDDEQFSTLTAADLPGGEEDEGDDEGDEGDEGEEDGEMLLNAEAEELAQDQEVFDEAAEKEAEEGEGGEAGAVVASAPGTIEKDLGNLAIFDPAPAAKSLAGNVEDGLSKLGTAACQILINDLFSLPSISAQGMPGKLVKLSTPSTPLPREKSLPKGKAETKWSRFAKLKGIQKRKKGRMVWDETKKEWAPRYGYKRANDDSATWAIPVKENDQSTEDPWTKMEREKKERVDSNKQKQLRNIKATQTTSNMRGIEGSIDITSTVSAKPGKRNQVGKMKSPHHVDVALKVAQQGTASMGRFDQTVYKEPSRKLPSAPKGKAFGSLKEEREKSLSVLSKISGANEEGFDSSKAGNIAMTQQQIEAKAKSSDSKKGKKPGKFAKDKGGKKKEYRVGMGKGGLLPSKKGGFKGSSKGGRGGKGGGGKRQKK